MFFFQCARLQKFGNESLILSVNKERETTTYKTTQVGEAFLQENPDFIEQIKNYFCEYDLVALVFYNTSPYRFQTLPLVK